MQVDKSVRESLCGITRFCGVMPNSDHEEQICLSAPNNHDRLFFLHTFRAPVFDFNVGVVVNESRSYMLTSAISKMDIECDVSTELRDLQYNQCIDNMRCFSIFIYPMGRIRACKIRFVSTGEHRGKPYLVCKKKISLGWFYRFLDNTNMLCIHNGTASPIECHQYSRLTTKPTKCNLRPASAQSD